MKLLGILTIFAVLAYASAIAVPDNYDGPIYELIPIKNPMYDETVGDLAPIRHRRVTCDLLSWTSTWFSVNHSACAARCLTQGRKGGRCHDGICVCRNR